MNEMICFSGELFSKKWKMKLKKVLLFINILFLICCRKVVFIKYEKI